MHEQWKRKSWGLALVMAATLLFPAQARERDDATARRQAMDEWYNETYRERGNHRRNHRSKKPIWSLKFERFMLEAARRERRRNPGLMPASGTSRSVIDPAASTQATGTTWTNIGPTKANYLQNGSSTVNATDTGRIRSVVTDPADPNTIYLAFSGGGVWKSTDGGAFWNAKTETLGTLSVGSLEMDPANANVLYLGLGDPFDGTGVGLAKSTDGANTWSDPIVLGDSTVTADIAVSPGNSNVVLVATNKGLYRSTNAGASFSPVTLSTGSTEAPYVWSLAWAGGSNFVLGLEATPSATSTSGQIWRSTDNGASWTRASGIVDAAGISRVTVASAPSNRSVLYALAANDASDFANLFKSTDGGATWVGVGTSKKGNRVTFKSYANRNTEHSTLQTIFNGQGWYDQMLVVDPANPGTVHFGGALVMARTTDGGATYRQVSNWLGQFGLPYVHADLHDAHYASNGMLFVGTDGGVFTTVDGGTTWNAALNEGIAAHLIYQVGSSTANRNAVIAGMQDNGTRVRVGATGVYNQELGGDGFGCDVHQVNANQMLGTLYYSRIYRSTDGGLNFTSACSGITECNNSTTAPFITVLSPWAGDATGNTLYTFSNTKVYRTTNYAGSWTALGTTGLPTSNLFLRGVAAAPGNGNLLGVVANGGRVFLSGNGGASWTTLATLPNNGLSLSSIAFDPANGNTIYVASVAPDATKTHLWKSTNAGASWAAIDGGGFPTGVPVNTVVVDPQSGGRLYAGTHLGVYASSDGGATWARFGAGMPLVNVTDLYVSADASLVRAATFGRSVWELAP